MTSASLVRTCEATDTREATDTVDESMRVGTASCFSLVFRVICCSTVDSTLHADRDVPHAESALERHIGSIPFRI